jgi:hypothetical protein
VSPILVRPVREQLEHDRVIRLLQERLKKRHDVAINIGPDQTVPVKIGSVNIYPDLVLTTSDKAKKVMGTVEVETAESVNHLEAMSQWAHLGRAKAPFHLYVPAGCVEIARRLAAENHVNVSELWSFHTIGDQTRFTLVERSGPESDEKKPTAAQPGRAPKPSPRTERSARPAAKKPAAAKKTAKVAAKKTARTAKAAKRPAPPRRK